MIYRNFEHDQYRCGQCGEWSGFDLEYEPKDEMSGYGDKWTSWSHCCGYDMRDTTDGLLLTDSDIRRLAAEYINER